MSVRVVRLGSPRARGEGVRIGTVRRPPRGVPKSKHASEDWYDVWFPNLAPSLDTMKLGLGAEITSDRGNTARDGGVGLDLRCGETHALTFLASIGHEKQARTRARGLANRQCRLSAFTAVSGLKSASQTQTIK